MAVNRIKLKEREKKHKYLDHARELKKLWNMKVTIIPIVIGAFDTVNKGACGVMIIVIGNGHGDTSSNPGRDRLHFTSH